MFQPDDPTAVAVRPAPSPAGTPGWFDPGDPATGRQPTTLRAEFMNGILGELLAILAAAGITPDKTQTNQLLLAIRVVCQALGDGRYVQTSAADFVSPQQLAAAVAAAIANLVDGAPALLNDIGKLATAVQNDESLVTGIINALATKANITDVQAWIAASLNSAEGFANTVAGNAQAAAIGAAEAFATSAANGAQAAAASAAEGFAATAAGNAQGAAIGHADAGDASTLSAAEAFATSAANAAAGGALAQANSTAAAGDAATLAAAEAYANGQASAAQVAAIAAAGGYDVLCDSQAAGLNLYHYILQWPAGKYSEVLVLNSGLSYPYQNNNANSQINYYLYAGGSINQIRICGVDTTYNVKQVFIAAANTSNPLINLVSYAGNSGNFNTIENPYVPGYPTYGGPYQYGFPGVLSGFACDIDIQANPGATFSHGRLLVLGRRAS